MQKEEFIIEVQENEDDLRLDKLITSHLVDFSRNEIQKIIENGGVATNHASHISQSSHRVKLGEIYKIYYNKKVSKELELKPLISDLNIVYEDEYLAVINKPAGLLTHPGITNHNDSLSNILLYHYPNNLSDIAGPDKRGIVHRLDKNTSGLIMIAKDNDTHAILAERIKTKEVVRRYKALVWGIPTPMIGTINAAIMRNPYNFKKMMVIDQNPFMAYDEQREEEYDAKTAQLMAEKEARKKSKLDKAKLAITHYEVKQVFCEGLISLVECQLETGRTHQIRVHLSHMGHTIIGDPEYGVNKKRNGIKKLSEDLQDAIKNLNRQFLHSYHLEFEHPVTGKYLEFTIDLSEDLQEILNLL